MLAAMWPHLLIKCSCALDRLAITINDKNIKWGKQHLLNKISCELRVSLYVEPVHSSSSSRFSMGAPIQW